MKGAGQYGGRVKDIGGDIKLLEMQTKTGRTDYLTKALQLGDTDKSITYGFTKERLGTKLWEKNIIGGWDIAKPSIVTRDVTTKLATSPEGTWDLFKTTGRGKTGLEVWKGKDTIDIDKVIFTAPKPADDNVLKMISKPKVPKKIDISKATGGRSQKLIQVQKPIGTGMGAATDTVTKGVIDNLKKVKLIPPIVKTKTRSKTKQYAQPKRVTAQVKMIDQIVGGKQTPGRRLINTQTPIIDTIQAQDQMQIPTLKLGQDTIQNVISGHTPVSPIIDMPFVPVPFIPPLPGGGGGIGKGGKRKKPPKRLYKFQPSLYGLQSKTKRKQRDFLTGFETRGVGSAPMDKIIGKPKRGKKKK